MNDADACETAADKKKNAELIISRKAAKNINLWNTKQAELKSTDATSATSSPMPAVKLSSVNATPLAPPKLSTPVQAAHVSGLLPRHVLTALFSSLSTTVNAWRRRRCRSARRWRRLHAW